jgi:glycosyltransferase involved in cell wall biosynthesis
MKVLQILPALDSGGVERGTLEISQYLAQQGHRSLVMSAGGRLVEQLSREGGEHHAWDIGRKSLLTLRLVPQLRRFLRQQRVDVLHLRSRLPAWIGYLAWRGMDPGQRPRLVTTVHGPYSVNRYSAIMTRGERVIVISRMIRDYVLNNYPEVPAERLRLIYRGVDPAAFPPGYQPDAAWLEAWYGQFPETQGKQLICLPARVTRWKGQQDLLELLARIKQAAPLAHGLIVGETKVGKQAFLQELQQQARQLGVADRLSFVGHRDDLREIMAISQIVLSLSREPEAFGRVSLEALSLGRPVIGYDHGGVAEQLNALLPEGRVALDDTEALVQRTLAWLRQPPQVAPLQDFTLQAMQSQTLALYQELLASPCASRS